MELIVRLRDYRKALAKMKCQGCYNSYRKRLLQCFFEVMLVCSNCLCCYISHGMGTGQPGHSVYAFEEEGEEKTTEATADVVVIDQQTFFCGRVRGQAE